MEMRARIPARRGEAQLAEWLARATGLPVVPEKKRWSLLYPPAQDMDIAGRIQIAPSDALYVGLSADVEGDEATSLECRIHGETAATTIRDRARRFVEIDLDSFLRADRRKSGVGRICPAGAGDGAVGGRPPAVRSR